MLKNECRLDADAGRLADRSALCMHTCPKGHNIISSRGETWRKYRQMLTSSLARSFDAEHDAVLRQANAHLCGPIQDHVDGNAPTDVSRLLQRYTSENTLESVFGVPGHVSPALLASIAS